jgi:hypothetical protein
MFFERDVKKSISLNPRLQAKAAELQNFNLRRESISKAIEDVETYLSDPLKSLSSPAQVEAAINLRKVLYEVKTNATPPIRLSAFYLSNTMLLWPAIYTFLGWLIFIFPPAVKETSFRLSGKRILFLSIAIVVLYRWPTWWRNTPFGNEGRVFYGNGNLDADPIGFYVQETLGAAVATLVAIVWLQWSGYYNETMSQLAAKSTRDPIEEALSPDSCERISKMFLHWQIASALLAFAFLWYTIFFWQTVILGGDLRYLPHAIIVHSMWIVTWLIISLPMVVSWYRWQVMHDRAIVALSKSNLPKDRDPARLAVAIDKPQPISSWNVAASVLAGATSLVVPILRNFLHW